MRIESELNLHINRLITEPNLLDNGTKIFDYLFDNQNQSETSW